METEPLGNTCLSTHTPVYRIHTFGKFLHTVGFLTYTVKIAERRYHIRVVQGYTGLYRVFTGFIQGHLGLFSKRG